MLKPGEIRLRSVGMGYRRGGEQLTIFDGLDLHVPAGDFVAVMGPSGSGKTTLLNMMGGLCAPQTGDVLIGAETISRLSQRALTRWRGETVGFVSQFYNLMPVLSAEENVELPLLLKNVGKARRRENRATALSIVGLAERARHYPRELSGGQQQRVAIARAIVSDPQIILADEPTGDLDRRTADEIMALLGMLNAEMGKTIVMVTHDPNTAQHARRILHLDKGAFVDRLELVA